MTRTEAEDLLRTIQADPRVTRARVSPIANEDDCGVYFQTAHTAGSVFSPDEWTLWSGTVLVEIERDEETPDGYEPTNRELANTVREAQDLLRQAINLLRDVVAATDDRNSEAYIVDHLRILCSNDHPFLSRDKNLDDWITQLENPEPETGDCYADPFDDPETR